MNVSNRIFLDHASGAPLDPLVFEAMKPYLIGEHGNPSALYREGVRAQSAVREAREKVARLLGARTQEIIFTGSGTESDNLAVFGVVRAAKKTIEKPHIIISEIEHPAVLEAARALVESDEADCTFLPVDENGLVLAHEVLPHVRENTVLVSVMYANSEIGTVQPIRQIVRAIKEYRDKKGSIYPYVHTDACQAMNYEPIHVESLGVDLLTFNGTKIYGPKGIGVLYRNVRVVIESVIVGGGQEFGMRPGTEYVAGIVGIAQALERTREISENESERLKVLKDHFFTTVESRIPAAHINGDRKQRLPNNIHISFPNLEEDVLVIELDERGVASSSKSACKSTSEGGSHVLAAIGRGENESGLRLSMGRDTTDAMLDYTADALCDILRKYKML